MYKNGVMDGVPIKIKDIKNLNFNITWRLLIKGLLERRITVDDIIEYAVEQLEKGNDKIEICELAWNNGNMDETLKCLYELADEEESEGELEERKLRAVILNNRLKKKKSNYVDGLLELTDLWIELGCPADSPHIIQGQDNEISPSEYYTESNYNYLFEKNKKWLKKEIDYILNIQTE